jgi:hypothetical protein
VRRITLICLLLLTRHFCPAFLIDDRYQSLRRQLNAYGFKKVISGPEKGYWHHSTFRQYSTFTEILACPTKLKRGYTWSGAHTSTRRETFKKAKDVVKDALVSSTAEASITEDADTADVLEPTARKGLPATGKATRSKPTKTKVTKRTCKKKAKLCKVKISKAAVPHCDLVELCEEELLEMAVSSIAEFELFSMEEVEVETLVTETRQSSPNEDALSALATVASFLPNAPTVFYSPGGKGLTTPNASTALFSPIVTDATEDADVLAEDGISGTQSTPEGSDFCTESVQMTVHAENGHILVPTPIKLTCTSFFDMSQMFEMGSDDGAGMEEDNISFSIGSLPSPYKLLLPAGDRSAFTPTVSKTDCMISEMCESMVSNMV